ncbi:hypothetical protein Tco_0383739, partial [Tanacetum coccineum]
KLNEATRKDHFPLPFMDQMLERLAGNEYYCLLVPTERLPTVACLSAYAMHQARSKGGCWPSFTTWLKRQWKSSWMTSRSLGILSKTASPVWTTCFKGVKTPT